MKLKDRECWLELYNIAKNIQKLEPWNYLYDMDLLVYVSIPLNDILYCSVMGHAGMHKAVAIYKGQQIHKFLDMTNKDYPVDMFLNYQECLMCNFIDRQSTLPKNRELIKELGINFRGTWISFENFEKGYEPSPLNIEQVKIMIEALKNFYMMFRAIIEQGMVVKFEEGETLTRHYDKNVKLFVNQVDKLMIPQKQNSIIKVDDDFKNDMDKLTSSEIELEYDFLNYLPIRIEEFKEKDGRNYYPRVRTLADRKSGIIIKNDFIDKNEYKKETEYIFDSIDLLIQYFYKYGKPKRIYVRDEETKDYLSEISEKANVKITVKPKLKMIDSFWDEFSKRGM